MNEIELVIEIKIKTSESAEVKAVVGFVAAIAAAGRVKVTGADAVLAVTAEATGLAVEFDFRGTSELEAIQRKNALI